MSDASIRITARVGQNLANRAKKMAAHKRWSLSVYVEEAIEEKVVIDEELLKARR